MGNLFAELKRRHIYRVAAAYAVVAWVLLQLFNNVAPILKLPDWAGALVLVLLVGGFPVAILFAWMQQLAPADGTTARAAASRLDWALIGALVVVIALVSYQQIVPTTGTRTAQQASVAPASGGIAVAVLPFANLSGDTAQEFFSDGMTEEIMTALAKVSALRIVGRESAFQFKSQKSDMHAVGQALGANYLVEGSVRKEGARVRITAQLVQADNGVSLWTDSYDRELTSVFATQSDIAQAIAGALRVPLGLKQGDALVRNRTNDVQSYDQYLRAKALVRGRGLKPITDAAALLEQVVARDPNYAPAWALLAQAYDLTPVYDPGNASGVVEEFHRIVDASLPKAEAAARRAIQLDANLADGYVSLGLVQRDRGKFLLAEDLFKQALAQDSNNPDALHWYSDTLGEVGRLKEALAMTQKLQTLEPFVPIFTVNTAYVLWLNGQTAAAIAMLKDFPDPRLLPFYLAPLYASLGRYGEAADILLSNPSGNYPPGMVEAAAGLLRTAPATAASPQTLPRLGHLGFVYLYVGAASRALESYEVMLEAGDMSVLPVNLWHSSYAPVRKTDRFKAYLRKGGFVDYWRARGWPDLCRPMGADDFVCD